MKVLDRLALLLVILAGIHLLLIGLFDINLISTIFGQTGEDIIYIIKGVAALWAVKYFGYTPKGGSRLKGR